MKSFLRLFMSILYFCVAALAANSQLSAPACGLNCISQAIAETTCLPTDIPCICSNQNLTLSVERCIAFACTVREQLSTKNYSMTTCGAPVRDKRAYSFWLGTSFWILSVVVFALRIISRSLLVGSAGFGTDDYFMFAAMAAGTAFAADGIALYIFGLGKDIWTLPFDNVTNLLFVYYHGEWSYFLAICLTKISMLFFYLRVFPAQDFRQRAYCLMVIIALYCISFDLASLFQCTPVEGAWKHWDGEGYYVCRNVNLQGWAAAIINMLLDLCILAMPIRPLSKLVISKKKKTQLVLMFSVGIFVTIVSILRLASLIKFSASQNPSWDNVETGWWSQIEIHVGNICACMPSIYSLFNELSRKIGSTHGNSSNSQQPSRYPTLRKPQDNLENFIPLVDKS